MVERRLALRNRIIGLLLRDVRRRSGRTQVECAQALGVSASTINAYEEGRTSISLPELEVLGYLLDTPITDLTEREPELKAGEEDPDFETLLSLRHRIIGVLLRQARLDAEMKREELAELLSHSIGRIADYERGVRAIPVSELELLAQQLELPLEYFRNGHKGLVGKWHRQKEVDRRFHQLPPDVQEFVTKPINIKYLELAMKLSEMSASKLRSIAEGLLEITY